MLLILVVHGDERGCTAFRAAMPRIGKAALVAEEGVAVGADLLDYIGEILRVEDPDRILQALSTESTALWFRGMSLVLQKNVHAPHWG